MLSLKHAFPFLIFASIAFVAIPDASAQLPKPALTQDIDHPARNAITFTCSVTRDIALAERANPWSSTCTAGTVPSGKIFVLETLNASIHSPGAEGALADNVVLQNGIGQTILVAPFLAPPLNGPGDIQSTLISTRVYIQPLTVLVPVFGIRPNLVGAHIMVFRAFGYLVTQ